MRYFNVKIARYRAEFRTVRAIFYGNKIVLSVLAW
jgi:hypothetical protein